MESIIYKQKAYKWSLASQGIRDLVGGIEPMSRAVWFSVVEDAHLSLGRLQQSSSVVIMVRKALQKAFCTLSQTIVNTHRVSYTQL